MKPDIWQRIFSMDWWTEMWHWILSLPYSFWIFLIRLEPALWVYSLRSFVCYFRCGNYFISKATYTSLIASAVPSGQHYSSAQWSYIQIQGHFNSGLELLFHRYRSLIIAKFQGWVKVRIYELAFYQFMNCLEEEYVTKFSTKYKWFHL